MAIPGSECNQPLKDYERNWVERIVRMFSLPWDEAVKVMREEQRKRALATCMDESSIEDVID